MKINQIPLIQFLILVCLPFFGHTQINVVSGFEVSDTVCINSPLAIKNTTIGGRLFYWSFCDSPLNSTPTAQNIGNPGGLLSRPTFIETVYENGNYYGFVINYAPSSLVRLDFGNSLLNTPTAIKLGNFGGIIPPMSGAEGLQVIQNEGKWYAIIVAGQLTDSSSRIIKLDFGYSITNTTPIATNWGNIGDLAQPIDLYLFKEGDEWHGFTVNGQNNTVTRFAFTNSFENVPIGINLGNLGKLHYPTGIFVMNDNGSWHMFITNGWDNSSISRLDFGSSLLNSPTAINLGNIGNTLRRPRDLYIIKFPNEIVGYVVNGRTDANDIVRLDFKNGLDQAPVAQSLGNFGNFNFPHTFSKLFRVGADLYTFVLNAGNNTITRLKFAGCNSPNIPNSTDSVPSAITYQQRGNYSISMMVDEGLATQNYIRKDIFAESLPVISTLKDTSLCEGSVLLLNTSSDSNETFLWAPTTGLSNSTQRSPFASPNVTTRYTVTATNKAGCSSKDSVTINILAAPSVTISSDTLVCIGTSVKLKGSSSVSGPLQYLWWPLDGLNSVSISEPTATPDVTTNYHLEITALNGCKGRDSVTVAIRQKPVFNINQSATKICAGEWAQLSVSGGDIYHWYPSKTVNNPADASTKVFPKEATTYKVIVTDTVCNVTDSLFATVAITGLQNTTIKKSNNIDCVLGEAQLTATGGIKYEWMPASSLSSAHIANPIAAPFETTTYYVKISNSGGCYTTDSIEVKVIKGTAENGYPVPNAFTPNDDGFNDCFGVKKWGFVTNLDFSIYTRTGDLIFHTKNSSECWKGTYKGILQPAGAYIYQIHAKTNCGFVYRKGTVMLIR